MNGETQKGGVKEEATGRGMGEEEGGQKKKNESGWRRDEYKQL